MKSLHVVNESITQMPPFNKTISIEVDVDMINRKFLDLLPEDYKHREVLSHAVIGSAVEKGNIGYIYNALNGYDNSIDFKEGDRVICTETERVEYYDANKEGEDGTLVIGWVDPHPDDAIYKPDWKTRSVIIGECIVKSINLYASDKLQVEFATAHHYKPGVMKQVIRQVNHKNCTRVI